MRDSYTINADFEGLRAAELVDDSLSNWCHHVQYILPQVSTCWNTLEASYIVTVGKVHVV